MSIPEENGGEVDSNEEKEEIMDKVTEDRTEDDIDADEYHDQPGQLRRRSV